MITYYNGDIFESRADCVVNPVNCLGVMGAGLAKEFKERYPGIMTNYKKWCKSGELRIGTVGFYKIHSMPWSVCLFPTKYDWREPSTLAYIDSSLLAFIKHASSYNIRRVAFPKVGCGLGGLDFEYQVGPLLTRRFDAIDIDVEVYV